ncbi:MAG TPA: aminoglycoside phosphotransferase family protein [Bryobacteraceae bacterium]
MSAATGRMHAGEFDIDVALVARLLAAQFPHWAGVPIRQLESAGTDHAMYRLGEEMLVRLPRIEAAAGQVEKEHAWLPQIAAQLPLAIPVPLAMGMPGQGYPWYWSVYKWLAGENAAVAHIGDYQRAALDLAAFVSALQRMDASSAPLPGAHNFHRGEPLAHRDARTREAIAALDGTIDTKLVTAAWDAALEATPWREPPRWIHGDLQPGNLLVKAGRVHAVIDFGGMCAGDPACDLIPAWNFLSARSRWAFRAALAADDATWARGRGWALSIALIALPYYRYTNPVLTNLSLYTITEVLGDFGQRHAIDIFS